MKCTRPRYLVKSQLKILTPVGIAISHRRNAEEGIDRWPGAHREEVVQPDDEGEKRDDDRAPRPWRHSRRGAFPEKVGTISEKTPKAGKHEDIYFWMSPRPNQVDVHHGIAATSGCKEVHAEIAVQGEHGQRCGQDREGENDQDP